MKGDALYPLGVLKNTEPEIYKLHAAKYDGRQQLLEVTIPTLNCLWNDVLHFSAVHPQKIVDALREAGDTKDFEMEYFEIDPHLLDPENTTVFVYAEKVIDGQPPMKEFADYNPDDLEKYSEINNDTKEYYAQMYAGGESPLMHYRLPHILHKGSIDTKNLKRIKI